LKFLASAVPEIRGESINSKVGYLEREVPGDGGFFRGEGEFVMDPAEA